MTASALSCEHANEVPRVCPCVPECYCKSNSCRPRVFRNMSTPESREFWESLERRVAADLFRDTHGCTEYTMWKIQFAMIWAVIASMMPRPKQPSRWTMLEIDP